MLDTCAAPGTKTSAIAERVGSTGRVWACDRHAGRLRLVDRDSRRLGLETIETHQRDATAPLADLVPRGRFGGDSTRPAARSRPHFSTSSGWRGSATSTPTRSSSRPECIPGRSAPRFRGTSTGRSLRRCGGSSARRSPPAARRSATTSMARVTRAGTPVITGSTAASRCRASAAVGGCGRSPSVSERRRSAGRVSIFLASGDKAGTADYSGRYLLNSHPSPVKRPVDLWRGLWREPRRPAQVLAALLTGWGHPVGLLSVHPR